MTTFSRATLQTLDDYTRQTVRAWWADGLWDLAMGGFFALTAWTWLWPFITREPINPMQREISLWVLGLFPFVLGYAWGAYKLVSWLKDRWLAPRLGAVRHPFWLPLERRALWLQFGIALVGLSLFVGLCAGLKSGPHFLSAGFALAPTGILFAVGHAYRLPRYQWLSAAGTLSCLALELLGTRSADYLRGPSSFFEVSPLFGNPALPCLVWAVACLLSGLAGLYQTVRSSHAHTA